MNRRFASHVVLVAAAAALFAPPVALAEVLYKLIDKNGKVTYSEEKPKNFDGQVIRLDINPNANTATMPKPASGADSGEPGGVLLGRRCRCDDRAGREERRNGVGEDDLADDAVGILLAVAHVVVPVAPAPLVAQVLERVLVLLPPRVEVVEILLLEELAVLRVAPARVRVGRDDRVALIGRGRRHRSS